MSYLCTLNCPRQVFHLTLTRGAVAVARGALVASYAVEERIEKHRNQRGQQNAGFKQGLNVMGQIAKVGRDILRSEVIRQTTPPARQRCNASFCTLRGISLSGCVYRKFDSA
jgi:hypothetical protein